MSLLLLFGGGEAAVPAAGGTGTAVPIEPGYYHGPIRIRHIREGAGTAVLAKTFHGSFAGVNGERGFVEGEFERRLNEEGTFSITFPNGVGDDGVLHRERFDVISKGKRTPGLEGESVIYGGGEYRPGDEWIEVYEGEDPGTLAFVGTPVAADISRNTVRLTGYDAMIMLKKTREATVGWWCHAPRDAFEAYTGVWVPHVIDHFPGAVTFAYSSSAADSSDGKWNFQRVANTGAEAGEPGTVRLYPGAPSNTATLKGKTAFNIGWTGAEPHQSWRMEVAYVRGPLFSASDSLRIGLMDSGSGAEIAYVSAGTSPGSPIDVGLDTEPPGPFRIAIEGHGRFIYFFANGKYLGHMPARDVTVVPYVRYVRGATTFAGVPAGEAWVDVDFIVVRRTRPFLMRGADKGDYHLPGIADPNLHPVDLGLVAAYYDDHDLQSEISDWSWTDRVLSPSRNAYSRRLELAAHGVAHASGDPTWQPSGPAGGEFFSARWSGAMYLDLENFDYKFRAISDDRIRFFLRETRFGEALIEDWTVAGHSPSLFESGFLIADESYPLKTAWYPMMFETSSGTGYAMASLQVARDDFPKLWMVAGEGDFALVVAVGAPASFWRMNDFLGGGTADHACFDHIGNVDGEYKSASWGSSFYGPGWVSPPLTAPDFDGAASKVEFGDVYDFAGTAAFSVAGWAAPDLIDANVRTLIGKEAVAAPAGIDVAQTIGGTSSTDANSYVTASTTPTANELQLLLVHSWKASTPEVPTVTGAGLTWVQVATTNYDVVGTQHRLTLFRALGASPTPGALTIAFGGVTQLGCGWSLAELGGVDTTGTNGSGAVVGSATASGSAFNGTVTLAAFGSASNVAFGGFGRGTGSGVNFTPGSGFVELDEQDAADGPSHATEWKVNDTSVDMSWDNSGAWGGIAAEVKAASGSGSDGGWRLDITTALGFRFRRRVGGTSVDVTGGTPIAGRWSHVAATYDGTNMRLYVNGALVAGPTASAGSLPNTTEALAIGKTDATAFFFDGRMQDWAVWTRAISAVEVSDHFEARVLQGGVVKVTPLGIYEDLVRYDSHYDVLRSLSDTYAMQSRCEPRQLESGEFPAQLIPRVRVGRDTGKILDRFEASSPTMTIAADEVVDVLLADAAGLADPSSGAQITAEAVNFTEVDQHLMIHEDYVSLPDIAVPNLFQRRLESMLALRGSAWEQVAAQPHGRRELADSFPLPGDLAEFSWEPGDSVRLQIEEIGVFDSSPRQILGVKKSFVPAGIHDVSLSFRQRPRSLGEMFRQLIRQTLGPQRNYQGQIVSSTSGHGETDGDPYARVVLPINLSQVIKAELVVTQKTDASLWNVEINQVNRFTVSASGRYDVRSYVGPYAVGEKRMVARLTGGAGVAEYHLELLIAV